MELETDVNLLAGSCGIAFNAAAFAGREDLVCLLLAREANLTATDGSGGNALHTAALS